MVGSAEDRLAIRRARMDLERVKAQLQWELEKRRAIERSMRH